MYCTNWLRCRLSVKCRILGLRWWIVKRCRRNRTRRITGWYEWVNYSYDLSEIAVHYCISNETIIYLEGQGLEEEEEDQTALAIQDLILDYKVDEAAITVANYSIAASYFDAYFGITSTMHDHSCSCSSYWNQSNET